MCTVQEGINILSYFPFFLIFLPKVYDGYTYIHLPQVYCKCFDHSLVGFGTWLKSIVYMVKNHCNCGNQPHLFGFHDSDSVFVSF